MSNEKIFKQTKIRRCISCRENKHKSEFLRVVRTPEGEFKIDATGKANGRGAYICKNTKCAEDVRKRCRLDKVFKSKVPAEFYDEICSEIEKLFANNFNQPSEKELNKNVNEIA